MLFLALCTKLSGNPSQLDGTFNDSVLKNYVNKCDNNFVAYVAYRQVLGQLPQIIINKLVLIYIKLVAISSSPFSH